MTTRDFDSRDKNPLWWTLKGGRHNGLSRHRGMHGLWYMVGTWGQGRYQSGWSIHVFPDTVRVSGYAGRSSNKVLTEGLLKHCLLHVHGSGGRDFGKSHMSKGGFRPGGTIAYKCAGKDFDPALLDDGDEFLLHVLGYEPTVEGVKAGVSRDEETRLQAQVAKEVADQAWRDNYQASISAHEQAKKGFEQLFTGIEIPSPFKHRFTAEGLEVWRLNEAMPSWSTLSVYDKATFKSVEAYQEWLAKMVVKLQEETRLSEVRAQAKALRDAEYKAQADKEAAEKAALEDALPDLDDILSNL